MAPGLPGDRPGNEVSAYANGFRFIDTFTHSLITRSIAATVKTRYRVDGWLYRQPEATARWFETIP